MRCYPVLLCGFLATAFVGTSPLQVQQLTASDLSTTGPEDTKIDAAIFASDGQMLGPKISPDGTRMVSIRKADGQSYLILSHIDDKRVIKMPVPDKASLNWYRWTDSKKLLFSVSSTGKLESEDVRLSLLYTLDVVTKQTAMVGPRNKTLDNDNVLYVDPAGKYIVLASQKSIYDYPSVYKVDLANNESAQIVDAQKSIWNWVADNNGVVRMGISYQNNAAIIYYRTKEGEKFERITKIKDDDDQQSALYDVIEIVSDKDEGYILSNKETGRFALYKFNYRTRETGKMVFGHDQNDVTGYNLSDDGKDVEAVFFTDDRDRMKWFDPESAKLQSALEKVLPGQEIWISSISDDRKRMIVFSTAATDPGSYYLFEPAKNSLHRFGGINDRIDPNILSVSTYVTYPARDGTSISAYLTLPKNVAPVKLPLIMLPHGGPFGVRDTPDYDPEVQFLVNRGYAVFQPNFRGSGSFGEAFYKLGEGQVGRMMQDDLDDGMDWLVKRGTVDADRVCIMGSSYGGSAALWGVTRNPERYRCAASYAGVTDWDKQLNYDGRFFSSRYSRDWETQIRGDKKYNLDNVSPVRRVDDLTRPVLLAHGEQDSNVPFSQFKVYREKLKDRGRNAEYLIFKEEGHGISDPENMTNWLNTLEAFLKKHNPPD